MCSRIFEIALERAIAVKNYCITYLQGHLLVIAERSLSSSVNNIIAETTGLCSHPNAHPLCSQSVAAYFRIPQSLIFVKNNYTDYSPLYTYIGRDGTIRHCSILSCHLPVSVCRPTIMRQCLVLPCRMAA